MYVSPQHTTETAICLISCIIGGMLQKYEHWTSTVFELMISSRVIRDSQESWRSVSAVVVDKWCAPEPPTQIFDWYSRRLWQTPDEHVTLKENIRAVWDTLIRFPTSQSTSNVVLILNFAIFFHFRAYVTSRGMSSTIFTSVTNTVNIRRLNCDSITRPKASMIQHPFSALI